MKKVILVLSFIGMFSAFSFGQLIDEKNVTVTMDLQPILQLNMTTGDQVDFIFDDIRDYYSGIIKYSATILKVSSSVSWDLYAVGTSQGNTPGAADDILTGWEQIPTWDQQMSYSGGGGVNATDTLPISLLELHQAAPNAYLGLVPPANPDYSQPFAAANSPAPGQNSIYASTTPYIAPLATDKYIQGHKGTTDQGAPGGSYLTAALAGGFSDYYFAIDYRIMPSLPAVFPNAGSSAGLSQALTGDRYANPGVYTMNAKYILLEDQ